MNIQIKTIQKMTLTSIAETQEKLTSNKRVNSYNEWDLLEEVIVGTPINAFFSFWDPIDKYLYSEEELKEIEHYLKFKQPYPIEYIKKGIEARARFINILEKEGVKVKNVEEVSYHKGFSTSLWKTAGGFCAANPRDLFIVIGNKIIEAPMCSRSRYFESRAYRSLWKEYAQNGAEIVAAPRPLLSDDLYNLNFASADSTTPYILTNQEPVFDAADFIRCGRDIIGQLSHVTNQTGVDWLQRHW